MTCDPRKLDFTLAALDTMDTAALARVWAATTARLHAAKGLDAAIEALQAEHDANRRIADDLVDTLVERDLAGGGFPLAESF